MLIFPTHVSIDHKKRLARALLLMNRWDETKPIGEWLSGELERLARAACREVDDVEMRRQQGAVLVLESLIDMMGEARNIQERLEGNK